MPGWRVPLADVVVSDEDIAAVVDAYRSGWLSMGPRTEALEERFAAYCGSAHAIAVANGTAALHLMCLAAGFGPGDEVVVPSMTFVATVNAVAYTGARPVFADVAGLARPWLSTSACEAVVNERTRGIVAMAYGGHAGEIEALARLARERDLVLLEDAAHAVGSRLHGRHLGTFGAAGAFSFFSNKNLAIGEGGMLVTDDDELAAEVRLLRSHGMTTLSWDRHRGHASGYDVVSLGFNYRMDEPRAALARHRLESLDEANRRRCALDERYRAGLADVDGVDPALPPMDGLESAHHLFAVVLDERIDRAGFREALAARGVQTSLHYPAVHGFSIYAETAGDLPVTDAYARRAVTLPLFPHMTAEQQDLVLEAVRSGVVVADYQQHREQ